MHYRTGIVDETKAIKRMSQDGETITITASAAMNGLRLDVFLASELPDFTRSYVKKRIDSGDVAAAGANAKTGRIKPNLKVQAGSEWTIRIPPDLPTDILPEAIALESLYEDDNILVINKPAGMPAHPGYGRQTGTVVNALLGRYGASFLDQMGGNGDDDLVSPARPGIVHRLDMDTSGVMVCAKTRSALIELQRQFRDRETQKEYYALTVRPPDPLEGIITAPLGKSPVNFTRQAIRYDSDGKPAETVYRTLSTGPFGAWVAAYPKTGRTHQIRVHLKSVGAPLYFDSVYGTPSSDLARISKSDALYGSRHTPRQMLHAASLTLTLPSDGCRTTFSAPLPSDFSDLIGIMRLSFGEKKAGTAPSLSEP
ncbi:MAG: RluA family pseudouridine synthase [Planctomycetota bacterium]